VSDSIKLPELDSECGTCQGSGIVTTPEWVEWDRKTTEAEKQWRVQHPGGYWPTSALGEHLLDLQPEPEMQCTDCNGTGCVLTADGRYLLAFLRTHGKRWPTPTPPTSENRSAR
jgi:predicted methyltransferase